MQPLVQVVPYFKVEGAGNVCLVVFRRDIQGGDDQMREFVRAICAKEGGLGADQLLEVESTDPLRIHIWNADGSTSGMCGNGARAILRLAETENWFRNQSPKPGSHVKLFISNRECSAERLSQAGSYEVNLGHPKAGDRQDFFHEGTRVPYWPVDVGNKHAVVFCGNQGDWRLPSDFALNVWGPRLCDALHANIEFVLSISHKQDKPAHPHLQVLVWEIGAGPTLACGSGAVAIAAAWQRRKKSLQQEFTMEMAGGALHVRLTPQGGFLSGPSSILGSGTFAFKSN